MAGYRLARRAAADLTEILEMSAERWGAASKRRYEAVLATAMRKLANDPNGPTTRERADLGRGIRSFHIRHARAGSAKMMVRRPVHALFYRIVAPGQVEIIRIMHERMDPSRNLQG